MNDEITFQNMDSWRGGSSGKFGLNFKQIVLMHIQRCVVNGSVEWHGGYWQERIKSNWTEKYYIQNSREVYCNSIKMLRALLLGYFDDKMKKADNEIQEEHKQSLKKYKGAEDKTTKYEYYSLKVDIHIRLFEELIMLSKRLNFFEEETSEEEM